MSTTNIFDLDNDFFAGCSRFRQCSDARKCLIPNRSDSNYCIYRKNIENGKIFIGKNANNFNIDVYNMWRNIYNDLPDNLRYELNCILLYYQKFRTSVFLWYNSLEVQKLGELGFISSYIDKNILQKFSMKFLRTLTLSKFRLKEDIINHLLNNEFENVAKYIDMFSYVIIPYDNSRYMFELYHDFVECSTANFTKALPLDDKSIFAN